MGYGSMGKRHAENARALGHDVRIYDPFLVEGCGTEAEAIDAASPDAVVIASPARHHIRQAKLVAGRGIPVLVEKPLGTDRELLAAYALPCGEPLVAVGYNLRLHEGVRVLRELLPRLGRLSSALVQLRCDMSSWPGGAYEDMLLEGSHEIDLALHLVGSATVAGAIGAGRAWTVLLHHVDGAASAIQLDGAACGTYLRRASVFGDAGMLTWAWGGPPSWGWTVSGRVSGDVVSESGAMTPDATYAAELSDFLAGGGWCCTLAEGLAVLEVCARARQLAGGDDDAQ